MIETRHAAGAFADDIREFLARTPHGYHDVGQIKAELQAAGFSSIEFETIQERSEAPNPGLPAIAYCQGTPLRGELEARDPKGLEAATARAAEAIAEAFGRGAVSGKIQAHVITARA